MRIVDQHEETLLREYSTFLIANGLPYTEVTGCLHEYLSLNQVSNMDKIIDSINEETRKIKEMDEKMGGK